MCLFSSISQLSAPFHIAHWIPCTHVGWEFSRDFWLDPVSESCLKAHRPEGLPWWKEGPGKHLKFLGNVNSSWPLAFLIPSLARWRSTPIFHFCSLSLLPSLVQFFCVHSQVLCLPSLSPNTFTYPLIAGTRLFLCLDKVLNKLPTLLSSFVLRS